ncbi:MAG: GFA family protein [Betaproteobacteria bacterium]|nr:GFA family protein [Betaproteobacteria bacterium]
MHVQGKCHCGRIAYEAEVNPEDVSACHCTDCQMLTGSAYRVSVRTQSARFRLLTGQPKTYIKRADSGARRAHSFCGDCGTPVYSSAVESPPTYSLRVGCLQQRAELPPRRQLWCRSALPWSENLGHVTKLDHQ